METMSLLGMGLTGALMVLVVIGARAALLNRLPKITFVALWLLVAARLLVPLSVPVPWNAYALADLVIPGAASRVMAAQGMTARATAPLASVEESTTAHLDGSGGALNSGLAVLNGTTVDLNGSAGTLSPGSSELDGTTAKMNDDAGALDSDTSTRTGTAADLNADVSALNSNAGILNPDAPTVGGAIDAVIAWLVRVTGVSAPLTVVWVVGSLLCAGGFAACYVRSRRRFAASLPVEDEKLLAVLREAANGLRRTVRLRSSDCIDTPLTYGVLRPTVLVPRGWRTLPGRPTTPDPRAGMRRCEAECLTL